MNEISQTLSAANSRKLILESIYASCSMHIPSNSKFLSDLRGFPQYMKRKIINYFTKRKP